MGSRNIGRNEESEDGAPSKMKATFTFNSVESSASGGGGRSAMTDLLASVDQVGLSSLV